MSSKNRAATRQARQDGKKARKTNQNMKLVIAAEQHPNKLPRPRNRDIVKPLTDSQRAYDAAFKSSDIIFGTGPAGTGKTWFATMRAAEAFDAEQIEKIVITRPAVEAGETLGFLPGELEEKYEPYIRPVRDALEEKFGSGFLEYLLKTGKIEARPLGLLRGSTFKDCWVILDEAQNVTPSQMQMFLTRIGDNCKMIINGDIKQKDVPGMSGLEHAMKTLRRVNGVTTVEFSREDIVRSGICRDIVMAYDEAPRPVANSQGPVPIQNIAFLNRAAV